MKSTLTRNYSFALLLICTLCVSSNAYLEKRTNGTAEMEKRFNNWLKRHGRSYNSSDEWNLRFGIYESNVQFIEFINSQNLTYKLTDNWFSDMTNLEFQSIYLGYKSHRTSGKQYGKAFNDSVVPSSIDWRKKGAVTSVKDQGSCGSCWAFSAVTAVEGISKIKTGKLVSLSAQELVDCDKGNEGCLGGYMDKAYNYIIKNGGISSEKAYPYQGIDGKCSKSKAKTKAAKISGFEAIPEGNETAIQVAVANQPVSVAIDAKGYDFQLYSSGVFTGYCGKSLNHGVTIVGYGVEDGVEYWLVKNSWGSNWGEGGYIKMKRGSSDGSGICGIAMLANYPTIDS